MAAQPPCADSLICLACRLDPRCLVEHLLAQANAGHRALVAIQGYRLLEELGRRDEGAVYLARHDYSGDRVALKVLYPGPKDGPELRARFRREAELVAKCRHPNLLQIYHTGEHEGVPYLALEYAEGVAWVVDGDADGDTQFDAIDLGAVALSWGLDGWVNATHSIVGDGFVDSADVTAIHEAFKNAFGGK